MSVAAYCSSVSLTPASCHAASCSSRRLQNHAFLGMRLTAGAPLRSQARAANATVCSAATLETPELVNLGPDLWNSTYYPTGQDAANLYKQWYIIDAEGQTLGRLAVLVADYIRGKNQATYTPSMDMGAYVVIINAEKVTVSGNKFNDKLYKRHTTGRPGSMKVETFRQLQARIPERIVEKAVKGMLPRGKLGNRLFHHLKVYKGATHPHEAQQPINITDQINKKRVGQPVAASASA